MVSVLHMSQSKSCMHFLCLPKRETYSARYFLWPFFLQTFGTEYALWNFLLCSLLRLLVSNPILGPTTSAQFTYSRCSDQATGWTTSGSITGTRSNFLFFESQGPTQSPIKRVPGGLLQEWRGRDVQLTTHLCILLRLRRVEIFLYSHHTTSWRA